MAEGSIYRHFPDKRALFASAILEGQQSLTAWMSDLPARAGTAPLLDVLTEAFEQLSTLRQVILPLEAALAAEPELSRVVAPANLQEAVARLGGPPHQLAEYLRAEQALGRIRAELDPTYTAIVLLAGLYGVQTSPLAQPDGLSTTAIRQLVDVYLTGLATS